MVALVLAVALAASALGSTQFTSSFQMTYSSKKPNSSSGLETAMTWSDPAEPLGKPKALKKIKFKFHPGTRFDTEALPVCRASDATVFRLGVSACPAATSVGQGNTQAIVGTVTANTVVHFFNAKRQIIVLVTVGKNVLTEFRDDVQGGRITVNLAVPPGTSLTLLHVRFLRHSRKRAGRRRIYMKTPPSCPPSGKWTTTATFIYVDGSTQQLPSDTPCNHG